ncbi:transcriptional regulator [Streptomycetaceae bacterium NBC_01309]
MVSDDPVEPIPLGGANGHDGRVEIHGHPLAYLLHDNGWSATQYLALLDAEQRKLGLRGVATRDRKRVTRWIRSGITPDMDAQRAMAALHGIAREEITARPWPEWLTLACIRERQLLDAPWDPETTIELLDRVAAAGGSMDRRGFLVVSGVAPLLAAAANAAPAKAQTVGRQIGRATPALFDQALAILRRQDDQLGSGNVYSSARAQLRLVVTTLKTKSYSDETSRQLYAAAGEASRICAWTAYDSGYHSLAEEYYLGGLRAARTADDPVVTANTLAFWAILRYSSGDPIGAVGLINEALAHARRVGSPRMTAMLYARLARAHAQAGDHRASARAQNAATDAYDRARDTPRDEDPDCVYWVNAGELEMLAGSSALNLGRPADALVRFTAAQAARSDEVYHEDEFPRGAAIYLAREAGARIDLDDLDGAVDAARRAVDHMGGVSSARSTTTLAELRTQFSARRSVPVVREWLELTR